LSKLNEFLSPGGQPEQPEDFGGMEWHASVSCQFCMERVSDQTLYPDKCLLVWTCSQGHRSKIENYTAF
jgi:hypothetical protein